MPSILLISDIHGNFPALQAICTQHPPEQFAHICNTGDCTVYAPYPNQTLDWLRTYQAISIRGNTDDKIIRLLKGQTFKKPGKKEKRIMYTSTAESLTSENSAYLLHLKKKQVLKLGSYSLGLFHGSPADHEEFLFDNTPEKRFQEIASTCKYDIIVTGHSHTPYHKIISGIHFINPGSVGRMFDGNPAASYAVLTIDEQARQKIQVQHFRCHYNTEEVVNELSRMKLPEIYGIMFKQGKKLN
ncbi:metallophosphoesterase family protein [Desulfogranum japonicum]|uniref:metallophosphoesterase family protein n=1 Tax=Desulfogranum japonicum TaxID=231447 RepID=UPI000419E531|nr:metallophosphoesterase family protein [Desulfogranum japonicum]